MIFNDQFFAFKNFNILVLFLLDFLVTVIITLFYTLLFKHRNYFLANIGLVLVSHMAMMFFYVIVYMSLYIYQIVGVSLFVEMFIWNIQLWQLKFAVDFYYKLNKRRTSIEILIRQYIKTLKYIFEVNPIYGKGLVSSISVFLPVNCFFLIDIIFHKKTIIVKLVRICFCVQQWMAMFLIHFAIAKQNSKLSSTTKQIVTFPLHKMFPIRSGIKLNLFIQTFHTKNRYGITYWMFGLVSMMAFIQFLMLYGQFFMFVLSNFKLLF